MPRRADESIKMDWLVISLFAVACAWAVLRVLGGERQRRLRDLEIRLAIDAAAAPEPTARR